MTFIGDLWTNGLIYNTVTVLIAFISGKQILLVTPFYYGSMSNGQNSSARCNIIRFIHISRKFFEDKNSL